MLKSGFELVFFTTVHKVTKKVTNNESLEATKK